MSEIESTTLIICLTVICLTIIIISLLVFIYNSDKLEKSNFTTKVIKYDHFNLDDYFKDCLK